MAWIYRIIRLKSGQCYIGHTTKKIPEERWEAHCVLLRSNRHHSRYLQNAWNKYGEESFKFEIIECCADAEKLKREQYWIDGLNSCFNLAKVAGSRKGVKFTLAQKDLLSKLRMGHKLSEETKRKIGLANKGNNGTRGLVWSAEARANMSRAVKGKPRTPAQRAATLYSLKLARKKARVNKPGMSWRLLRRLETTGVSS